MGICEENKERGFKKKNDCLLSCSSTIPTKYYCNIQNNTCDVDNSYGTYDSVGNCINNSVCSK